MREPSPADVEAAASLLRKRGLWGVERSERSAAVAARGLREVRVELDELAGEDRLQVEGTTAGLVVADLGCTAPGDRPADFARLSISAMRPRRYRT